MGAIHIIGGTYNQGNIFARRWEESSQQIFGRFRIFGKFRKKQEKNLDIFTARNGENMCLLQAHLLGAFLAF